MDEERRSVFVPKESSAKKEINILEKGPLGELAEDQRIVRNFEFYFDRILSGQVTSTAELDARLNQRIRKNDSGGQYLANDQGESVRNPNGTLIFPQAGEFFKVEDEDQRKLLIELYGLTA